eukprot:c10353_g1_i1.p1 GENE.c10353_g1_i1~~c10353_g1_i1.p1  ORF type:complete len:566 (+),score=111.85 c10353_g1_i1:119-1816(+)
MQIVWDPAAPFLYRIMQFWFSFLMDCFYSTIEVNGLETLTDKKPVLLCANHSNSLADGAMLVGVLPRLINGTAKDTVFKDKFWGPLVASAGAIPIYRRLEHGDDKTKNANTLRALIDALSRGACVFLCPEGVSRYRPGMHPLRRGAARILMDTLEKNQHDENFTIRLVSAGLTYLHREKFRSDVNIQLRTVVEYSSKDYAALKDTPKIIEQITEKLGDQLQRDIITAHRWALLEAGHMARRIHAPLGTRISLTQHVELTQRFVAILSLPDRKPEKGFINYSEAKDPEMLIPVLPPPFDNHLPTQAEAASLRALTNDLIQYSRAVDDADLTDERVRNKQPATWYALLWLVIYGLWGILLLALSVPGLCAFAPVYLVCRMWEGWMQRTNIESAEIVRNMDEISMYKMVLIFFLGIPSNWWAARVLAWFAPLPHGIGFALPFCPPVLYLVLVVVVGWLTIRWIEDGFACLRSSLSLYRLLTRRGVAEKLREMRRDLQPRIAEIADRFAVSSVEDLLEKAPPQPSAWSCFSIRRRRKKDWGEVMHICKVTRGLSYPEKVLARFARQKQL